MSMSATRTKHEPMTELVVCQRWTESDEGWMRPGGYTVHRTPDDCKKFCEEFWRNQRKELGEATPPCYVREEGDPMPIAATKQVVQELDRLKARSVFGAWGDGDYVPSDGVQHIHPPQTPGKLDDRVDASTLLDRLTVLHYPLVVRACAVAARDFDGISRKSPGAQGLEAQPYFSHLQRVAILLAEQGYGPEVIAAAYLHDVLEDLPKKWTKQRLTKEFGKAVTALVDAVTQQDRTLPWKERQEHYLKRLRSASSDAISLSMADKISNLEDLVAVLRAGFPVTSVLKRGWKENSEKFHKLGELFNQCGNKHLFFQFLDLLDQFDELGPKNEASKPHAARKPRGAS